MMCWCYRAYLVDFATIDVVTPESLVVTPESLVEQLIIGTKKITKSSVPKYRCFIATVKSAQR